MRERDQETYERVEFNLDTPMLLLSFAFALVLLIPLVSDLSSTTARASLPASVPSTKGTSGPG